MPLYEFDNVTHYYNGRKVLRIPRWQVEADTLTGIAGPNGSGKSTLLSILGFVQKPSRGVIRFQGRPAEPFGETVRGKAALLPQSSFLLKRSVYRNIAYGLRMQPKVRKGHERIQSAMEMVGLDPDIFSRRPWYALSGGEARRVSLAARLVLRPQVLLMDEPTASVDVDSALKIKEAALYARRQWGTTLIIASHDTSWLADISDHTIHLFRGTILGNGKQTLISGPWRSNGEGSLSRDLSGGQSFEAKGAPEDMKSAVAAIEAQNVYLYRTPEKIPPGQHHLEGLLLRLNFEQSTGRTSAAVRVGGVVFDAYLPEDELAPFPYIPGGRIWMGYDPRAVVWY